MPTHWTRLLTLTLGLWASAITTCQAETFPISDVVPASVPDEQRELLQSHAHKLADGMFNHLLLRIDEIDRLCELSESQLDRLTIAAKGAVQHRIDEFVFQIVLKSERQGEKTDKVVTIRLKQSLIVADGGAVGVVVGDVSRAVVIPFNGVPGLLKVMEQDIWRGTIDRTLTEQQFDRYSAALEEREALPREWRGERVMIEFDRMLRLDRSQREPLSERLAKFLEMSQTKRWLKRRQGYDDAALARMALRAIPSKDVQDVLSSRQLLQWQLILREDLKSR